MPNAFLHRVQATIAKQGRIARIPKVVRRVFGVNERAERANKQQYKYQVLQKRCVVALGTLGDLKLQEAALLREKIHITQRIETVNLAADEVREYVAELERQMGKFST